METVVLKVYTVQNTLLNSSPAVKIKDYVLALAGPLGMFCESYDCGSVVDIFRQYKFQVVSLGKDDANFQSSEIRCIAAYECDFIRSTLDKDLCEVRFGNESDVDIPSRNFGLFVLFSLTDNNVMEAVHEFFDNLLPINRKMIGSPVVVVSTPFQNLFLFNAHSGGIICNVLGRKQCLFLTDVKLSSGCEGAPVYSIYGDLIGAVINVFTWCRGEWMGFSLAVHLYPVLESWLIALKQEAISIRKEISFQYSFVEDIDSYGIVLISGSGIWGSGVILDKSRGLIVTCSHVISYSTRTDVQVEFKRKKYDAEVLYATVKNSPFDLAVVRIRCTNFKDVKEFKIPTSPLIKGEPVYMIGYPLFSFRNHTVQGPSVTYGHISNIHDGAMIVATCASNSGSSGGALMRKNGELIGVVASNFLAGETIVPHLTVAIPTSVFVEPIGNFGRTNDINALKCLTSRDENVLRIWRLEIKCKL